ncbi:hypothetical protein KHQ06_19045 [Nocardia tengchongensis]|uniref:Clp R domain-containing protein n=1 Tax=Nocardia tengchongensis TaxID=2055889 RepID=A0ABX8CGF6_9NOCA|nr:Clp protease N-terminal domain-containing protein [Nocardia tengchongensis]QVI18659.1 hypothetical protein KHQ06_19045 [Nocardia tengchongensis]
MFERFTDTARRTIVLAQEEARLLGHDWIGTEHLLLGLLRGDDPIAGQTLGELGLDLSGLRERVDQAVGVQDSHAPAGHIPFTARSKKVLENSLREAMRLQHSTSVRTLCSRGSEGDRTRPNPSRPLRRPETRRQPASYIGPEHLLLALVRRGPEWPRRS